MASTSGRKGQALYVLTHDDFYWLFTLSSSRTKAYLCAKPYCRNPDDYRRELKEEGVRCVKVQIVESA